MSLNYLSKIVEMMGVVAEKFTVKKKVRRKFRIALVYPNVYKVAISNLGFRILYHLLNLYERAYCERFTSESGRSLETGSSISEFNLIMFTYQYEPDLFEIVRWVVRQNLSNRMKIVGGPCVYNPFPLKGLTDYVYVGEAEASIIDFINEVIDEVGEDVLTTLKGVLDLENMKYSGKGFPEPLDTFLPSLQASSKLSVFGDALLVDVSRGCRWSCKFCFGRYVYSPYRERSIEQLTQVIEEGLKAGRYESLVLISADLNSYSRLNELIEYLRELQKRSYKFKVVAPSLRIDNLNEELIEFLVESGEKTITLAPESSEDLRYMIGKKFTDEDLLKACTIFKRYGVKKIKLYFMFGLPGETMQDLESIIGLVREIMKMGFLVRVSANPFVPKPHTPFEDEEFGDVKELKERLRFLKKELKDALSTDGIRQAFLQSIIARGDEEIGKLVVECVKSGEPPTITQLKRNAERLGIDLKEYAKHGSEAKPWKRLRTHYL
ncbi:MAG: radical SAM protein [Nitrososphaerota archaeon]